MNRAGAIEPVKSAIRWCRVVLWQSDRLRHAFDPPGPASGVRPGFFDRIAAEQHFLLIATSQLERSLRAMQRAEDVPSQLREPLRLLRNVREHWDEWEIDKGSASALRERFPDVIPWSIQQTGADLIIAGLVPLNELESAVQALLASLLEERER